MRSEAAGARGFGVRGAIGGHLDAPGCGKVLAASPCSSRKRVQSALRRLNFGPSPARIHGFGGDPSAPAPLRAASHTLETVYPRSKQCQVLKSPLRPDHCGQPLGRPLPAAHLRHAAQQGRRRARIAQKVMHASQRHPPDHGQVHPAPHRCGAARIRRATRHSDGRAVNCWYSRAQRVFFGLFWVFLQPPGSDQALSDRPIRYIFKLADLLHFHAAADTLTGTLRTFLCKIAPETAKSGPNCRQKGQNCAGNGPKSGRKARFVTFVVQKHGHTRCNSPA